MIYKCLNNQVFTTHNYKIVPIRIEDRQVIMKWRNEQIYHLRQDKPLTIKEQDNYFDSIISKLFDQEKPNQILFSYLEDDVCIGYGGLVHINWIDKNAEISFIMKTDLEKDFFAKHWSNYLLLIEKVAFEELNFHKIFTFAFNIRLHLYLVLESVGFKEEARLKEHCLIEGQYLDVVYHCKMNREISYRNANKNDVLLYFNWANDSVVRENSYKSTTISLENHTNWFLNKINDSNYLMLVFENHNGIPIGQVRIQKQTDFNAIIGVSNDVNFRGKGYASPMIEKASALFLNQNPLMTLSAYIKIENKASVKAFEKAGYLLKTILEYENSESYHYIKKI